MTDTGRADEIRDTLQRVRAQRHELEEARDSVVAQYDEQIENAKREEWMLTGVLREYDAMAQKEQSEPDATPANRQQRRAQQRAQEKKPDKDAKRESLRVVKGEKATDKEGDEAPVEAAP